MCNRLLILLLVQLLVSPSWAMYFPDTIDKVKKSIVAVGSYHPTGSPKARFSGTGFVIGDGSYVVTNYHVVPTEMDKEHREKLVIFHGRGYKPAVYEVSVIKKDRIHDLALLKIKAKHLTPLKLGNDKALREGEDLAITGFPIGSVLGLYPATHNVSLAAITPIAIPQVNTAQLTARMLKQLRRPYEVFQLDGTAYPGNSGSPVYHKDTGNVVGVINKVFVQGSKEAAISAPSGISYAIPIRYVKELLKGS